MIHYEHDCSYEELGKTITAAHQKLQFLDKEQYHIGLKQLERLFSSWLAHPVGRNWELNRNLKTWLEKSYG